MKKSINATLFFFQEDKKIVAYQPDTELFFEENTSVSELA
jgi:hypothetical protein